MMLQGERYDTQIAAREVSDDGNEGLSQLLKLILKDTIVNCENIVGSSASSSAKSSAVHKRRQTVT